MESLGWWDLPVQPIHGDYCQFNCRFRSSDVVAVIDWDHARLAPRLLDVAHALNITLGWPSSIDYYEDFRWSDAMPLEPADVSAWLAKYCRSGAPLDGREVQILPWACLALWPWQTAGFCLQNAGTANGAAAVVDYAEQIETASTLFVEAALAHAE
jgi:Ser/Thr protein kinase RdoA (MazF antagonist)